MKVSKEKTGPCEYTLNVEVEAERLQVPLRQAAQRLNKRRPIAGFRPGKAPYTMVERVYGKGLVYEEMLDKTSDELYQQALKESELTPYAAAHLEIVQLEPLTLKFVVPTQPQITLGDYHKIHVEQRPVEVGEADVDKVLARIRDANAVWIPVERAVQMGDQVLLDAVGTADDGGKTEQQDLTVEVSEQMVPPGFGQKLIGIKPGESKEFDVEYPADFRDQDLAGKRVHFNVTVKAVREKELPALNDELAKSAGPYETLAQLRDRVREELRTQKEAEAKDEALSQALDALVEQATLEYPAVAVEHEIDSMIESLNKRLQQQGFTLQGYLDMMKKTPAQLREETRPQAEIRLKRSLALVKFAEAEGIQVEAAEVEQEADRISQPYGEQAGAVKALLSAGDPLRSITNDVFRRKALDRLLAIATGQVESIATQAEGQPETN